MPPVSHEALLLAPLVLLAYTSQTITGFGATLIAITIGAHFMAIERLVPVLIPLTILATGTVALKNRSDVDKRLLVGQIFPFMGAGIILGLALYGLLRGMTPRWLLGLIVVVFASRQLWLQMRSGENNKPMPLVLAGGVLVMAGVAQALFTTGGPFITYAIMGKNLSKAAFRATLSAVWSLFNIVLTAAFLINGRVNRDTLIVTAPLVLVLPFGLLMGEWLHRRIDENLFKKLTCILLILSGLPLVFS